MVLLNKIKNKLLINYRKKRWPGLIEAYKQYLPITKKTPIISLNEGNTPLILSESISNLIGNETKVFLKYDGLNPTGSFKEIIGVFCVTGRYCLYASIRPGHLFFL